MLISLYFNTSICSYVERSDFRVMGGTVQPQGAVVSLTCWGQLSLINKNKKNIYEGHEEDTFFGLLLSKLSIWKRPIVAGLFVCPKPSVPLSFAPMNFTALVILPGFFIANSSSDESSSNTKLRCQLPSIKHTMMLAERHWFRFDTHYM